MTWHGIKWIKQRYHEIKWNNEVNVNDMKLTDMTCMIHTDLAWHDMNMKMRMAWNWNQIKWDDLILNHCIYEWMDEVNEWLKLEWLECMTWNGMAWMQWVKWRRSITWLAWATWVKLSNWVTWTRWEEIKLKLWRGRQRDIGLPCLPFPRFRPPLPVLPVLPFLPFPSVSSLSLPSFLPFAFFPSFHHRFQLRFITPLPPTSLSPQGWSYRCVYI